MKTHLLIAALVAATTVGCSSSSDDADTSPAVVEPSSESTGPVIDPTGAGPDRNRVSMNVTTYPEIGIALEFRRTYAEAVDLEKPTTRVGDRTYTGAYWTMAIEASSEEPVNDRASIPAGGEVVYQAMVRRPDCDAPDLTPEIRFTLPGRTGEGARFVDRIEPTNPARDFATALKIYCGIGIAAEVFPSDAADHSRNSVDVRVSNGTDAPVRVDIPALTNGTGQDVPWQPGRVLVDGVATPVPILTEWCR